MSHPSIVITLAKPQYAHPGFGYFKLDFKTPKYLPRVHYIETRRISLKSPKESFTPIMQLAQVMKDVVTSPVWNTACLIRKAVNTFVDDENPKPASLVNAFRRADNFIDVPNQMIPFDLDVIPADKNIAFDNSGVIFDLVDAYIVKYLPEAFHNVQYLLQLTPSFRPIPKETLLPKGKLHVRVYFLSTRPVYTAQLSNYPWKEMTEEDKSDVGLEVDKVQCCIDRSIYRPCQPIYVANPQFVEEQDPMKDCPNLPGRWMLGTHHEGKLADFDVSNVPFLEASGQRNEIRSIMHMTGIEGAYCRRTDWSELLPQFGYHQGGFDDTRWTSPHSDSSIAGVMVNKDGRIWSHHSPEHCIIAKSGRMLTAFDFMREFIFGGNYKAALAYAAPTAKKDPKYQEELKNIANSTINMIMDFIDSVSYHSDALTHEYDGLMSQNNVYKIILEEVIRGSMYDFLSIDRVLKILAEKLSVDGPGARAKYAELKLVLTHIYDDVAKREARSGRLNYLLPKATDETNAIALINAYGGHDTLRAYNENSIYAFKDKFWQEYRGLLTHKSLISEFTIHDTQSIVSLNDNQKVALTKSFHTEVLRFTSMHDEHDDFIIAPNIIPLKDCVIDISNWLPPSEGATEEDHRFLIRGYLPTDHVLKPLKFDYDPNAKCPKFLKFIDSIYQEYPELVKLQQHKFGYILTTGNLFQKIFMQRGERRSGKGTLDRIMKELLPSGYFEPTTFEKLSGRFGQAVFKKAKVINIPDYKKGTLNAKATAAVEEVIISATGGDNIAIEEKYGRQEGVKPVGVLTISSNELLDIQNINAFFSRLIVFPHMISFEGVENFNLEKELMEELPGILNWALEGLYELGKQGRFIEPNISNVCKEEMIETLNPMSAFIRRYYYIDKKAPNKECTTRDGLKTSFITWLTREDTSMTPDEIERYSDPAAINSCLRALLGTIDPKKRTGTKADSSGKIVNIRYGILLKPEIRQIRDSAIKRIKDQADQLKYNTDADDISVIFDEKYCDLSYKLNNGKLAMTDLED
jgi:hypothetical protein